MWDPFTQSTDSTCIYDWSGNDYYGSLLDQPYSDYQIETAPPLKSETLSSGVEAAYYYFGGDLNNSIVPIYGQSYDSAESITAFTFASWIWTDYFSLTTDDFR